MNAFFARLIGGLIGRKLKLQEGPMEDTKKWYKSKTAWSGIVSVLIVAYNAVGVSLGPVFGFNLPAIPEWVLAMLGAIGVYGRVTADTKIG